MKYMMKENGIIYVPEIEYDDDANVHNIGMLLELFAPHNAIVVFAEYSVEIKVDIYQ